MLKLLIVAAVCLLGVELAASELPPFKDTTFPCYRLPLNVRPTAYETYLKFPSLDSDQYEGHVNISLQFVRVKPPKPVSKRNRDENNISKSLRGTDCSVVGESNQIVLHADERLVIQDIKIRTDAHLAFLFKGGQKKRNVVGLVRDRSKQMIGIKVSHGIYPDSTGKLTITFKGTMRNDKRGVYLSTYQDGDKVYKHVVSQFQATDARTAFPCFDEPQFKIPIKMSISHPQNVVAYGNTDVESVLTETIDSLATTTFATTPKMPVHMVGFTVGHFDRPLETVSGYNRNGKKAVRKVRIITAPGKRHTAHFALDVAKRSLEWFEDYIDFEYPLTKFDIIAIADHERGNTETWGIGFVRDTLIWIDYETKMDTRITTAVNVAHIAVHQWFANLITCAWWQDLWITEGVAAQFAFRIVNTLYRDLESEFFLRLATLESAMQDDQPGTKHALSPPLGRMKTIDDIDQIFDKLEFTKSAALAQMIMDAVGAEWYQKTLRRLVAANSFGSVNFADYIRALTNNGERNNDQMTKMIRTFADYQGVPLINVVTSDIPSEHVSLSVERFDQAKKRATDAGQLPTQELTLYTTLTVQPNTLEIFINTQLYKVNFDSYAIPLKEEGAVKNGYIQISKSPTLGAFYRSRYSDELYDRLKPAIGKRIIEPMSRLQILEDANALVQAQLIQNDTFKGLLDAYANEDNGGVILQMLLATKTLASLNTTDTSPTASLKAFLNLFGKYGFQVSGQEPVMLQRARQATLTALINQGYEEVIGEALNAFVRSSGDVALFLREPVYTAIVRTDSEFVERLFNKLDNTRSYEERIRLVTALSLSKNLEVLERLNGWLNSSDLKPETKAPFLETISSKLAESEAAADE